MDESNEAPLTRDSLQRMALQLLNTKSLPALRTRLAEHIVKDSTPKEQKNLLGAALLQPRVENLGGQLVLHANPKTIHHGALAAEAAQMMEQYRITSVLVVDDTGRLCGAVNSNDLMRAKVI